MYQFVKAVVIGTPTGGLPETITSPSQSFHSLLTDYRDGYIELSHRSISGPTFLTLRELRVISYGYQTNHTIAQWLAYIGNRTIVGSELRPVYSKTPMLYDSMWQSSMEITRAAKDEPLEGNYPDSLLRDLKVKPIFGSIDTLQTRALFTLNGSFHRSEPISDGVVISGVTESVRLNQDNRAGVLSFAGIGEVRQIPITEEMLSKQSLGSNFLEGTFINLDRLIEGQSVGLVLGGVLHVNDEICRVINPQSGLIKVNMKRIDPVRQVSRTYRHVDLTALGVIEDDQLPGNTKYDEASDLPGAMNAAAIQSDLVLKRLLTHPQSFVVLIDAPRVVMERELVEYSGIPGVYYSKNEPLGPLVDVYGRVHEYHLKRGKNKWVMFTAIQEQSQRLYTTMDYKNSQLVNNVDSPQSYEFMTMEVLNMYAIKTDYVNEST